MDTSIGGGGDSLIELRRWLTTVNALAEAVNSARSLPSILELVAHSARSLMGFDFCAVLLPDQRQQNLVITGWSGLSAEYVARVNADRPVRLTTGDAGQAPSSKAFTNGRAVSIRDIAVEPEFTPWGGVAREQGYRAMVSVPLTADGEVVGTLNGYHAGVHDFREQEIERLTLLANHAAIALTSARMAREAQSLNESLRQQTDLLTKSEQIHQQLLAVALRGGGLPGIAAALSTLVSRPVLIEDIRGAVLASAGDPADLPDAALRASTAVAQETLTASVVPGPGGTRFLVWTVQLEDAAVARMWLPREDSDLSAIDGRAVEHASIVLALEMVRLRTGVEVELRLRGELLADILGGAAIDSRSVRERAERLGHDLSAAHVAVVGLASATDPLRIAQAEQQWTSAVTETAARYRPRPLVAMYRGLLVALWPVGAIGAATAHPADSGARQAADAVRRAMASGPGVGSATVAVVGTDRPDYPQAYRIARGALDIALRTGRTNTTITLDDLGVSGLLLQLDDPGKLLGFADRTLAAVRRHDEERGTRLLQTLRSYLDNRLNRVATGRELHVHPNTVTQRLQRIETLARIDLADPDSIVELQAALTVLDVAQGGRPQ
jgi:sugar diacid utilization regulator